MKDAWNALSSAEAVFDKLDDAMPKEYKETWLEEERRGLNQRVSVLCLARVGTNVDSSG